MILPDHEIRGLGQRSVIKPFEPGQIQPSSYDVRLDRFVRVARQDWHGVIDLNEPAPDWTVEIDLDPDGHVLRPGECALGSTIEHVDIPPDLCCRVDGKSSLARYFLQIHSAGFVDPGYQGNITLEIVNFGPRPIRLRYGRWIAQIEFLMLSSAAEKPYSGRYQGSLGPVASRYNASVDSMDRLRVLLSQPVDRFPRAHLTDPDAGHHNSA